MPETDNKINYSLRPQKAMERRMMCDLLKVLNPTFDLSQYSYVGMGAKYFADFLLFHRELGINKMKSIEADVDHKKKYDFNVPLKCIEMYYGLAKNYIDSYENNGESVFFWLDYDYGLDQSIMDDCNKLINKLNPGDLFFVSFNSMIANRRKSDSLPDYCKILTNRFKKIREGLGAYAPTSEISPYILMDNLKRDGIFVDVLKNMIDSQISTRNSGGEKLSFFQMAFFSYSDGADMVTWGGMLVDEEKEKLVRKLLQGNSLPSLTGIKWGEQIEDIFSEDIPPFDLRIPLLTYREFIALQREFPAEEIGQIDVAGFEENELKQLNKLYRYYSPYLEAGVLN